MHPQEVVDEALRLRAQGLSGGKVAARLSLPRSTVESWLAGKKRAIRRGPSGPLRPSPACPACGDGPLSASAYAYLLGLYLGDGHIVKDPRAYRLGIALDSRYPNIIGECVVAIRSVRGKPSQRVTLVNREGCVEVVAHWQHWACAFPQHGPGRKHERRIHLTHWQQDIVDANPEFLLRGLIHSDGWRGTNRVKVNGKSYAYPRYQFSNRSDDIMRIFCDACDAFGVEWRRMNRWNIAVSRRPAVARLDSVVGPKT